MVWMWLGLLVVLVVGLVLEPRLTRARAQDPAPRPTAADPEPVASGWVTSRTHGMQYHLEAYGAADLTPGHWVELSLEPSTTGEGHQVALRIPGGATFGHLHPARAASVADRLAAGEDLAAVTLRGPGPGRVDESTLLLIGERSEVAARGC